MARAIAALMILSVTACAGGTPPPPAELPWHEAGPKLRFDDASGAGKLTPPAELRSAKFGYFGDRPVRGQYSATQLEAMRRDEHGFAAMLDLDGNGRGETYRTGFWMLPEGRAGTFLVAIEDGRQVGWADTGTQGVFLGWRGGVLRVADCVCDSYGIARFDGKSLSIEWHGERPPEAASLP